MRNLLTAFIIVLFAGGMVRAEDENGGQAGNFRDIELGGRASAMGGAFTAIAEGGEGHIYNPGGGAQSRLYNVCFSYRFMKLDRRLGFASVILPIQGNASLAFSWVYAGTSDLDPRDESGNVISGEIIDYNENMIGINFAKQIIPEIHAGAKLYYIQNDLANLRAYTAGADIGVLSKVDVSKSFIGKIFPLFHSGLAIDNLGGTYRWITTDYWQTRGIDNGVTVEEGFPVNFRLGLAGSKPQKYILAADFEINTVSSFVTHFGGEYKLYRELALRAGLDDFHPTFGVGLYKRMGDIAIGVDMSYLTDKVDEGDDFIISVDMVF